MGFVECMSIVGRSGARSSVGWAGVVRSWGQKVQIMVLVAVGSGEVSQWLSLSPHPVWGYSLQRGCGAVACAVLGSMLAGVRSSFAGAATWGLRLLVYWVVTVLRR